MSDGSEFHFELPPSGETPDFEQLIHLNEIARSREAFFDAAEAYFNDCNFQTRTDFEATSCDWLNAVNDYVFFLGEESDGLMTDLCFEEIVAIQFDKDYDCLIRTLSDLIENDEVFMPLALPLDAIIDLLTVIVPGEEDVSTGNIMQRRIIELLSSQLEVFTTITEARHLEEGDVKEKATGNKLLLATGKTLLDIGKMATAVYLAIKLSGLDRKKQ